MALLEESRAFGAALSWDWIKIWLNHFGDEDNLRILTAREQTTNELIGIAPLIITKIYPKYGSGYRQLEFIGASHHLENLDFIIKPGYESETISAFIQYMMEELRDWDALSLAGIANMDTCNLIHSSRSGWNYYKDDEMISPYIPLPNTEDEWMMSLSKRRRKKLRQHHRKLNDEFPGSWAIHQVATQQDLDEVFPYLVRYHQAQWEELGQPGAFYYGEWVAYYQELMSTFLQKGWLRFYYLTIKDTPVATLFSIRFRKYAYDMVAGNDYSVTEVPVGHVLTHHNIVEAIKENMNMYLLMWGDQPYKYSFGAVNRTLHAYVYYKNLSIKLQRQGIHFLQTVKAKFFPKADSENSPPPIPSDE